MMFLIFGIGALLAGIVILLAMIGFTTWLHRGRDG